MKNKKYMITVIIIFLLLILIFYYKNLKKGNNIGKSITDFKQYILNISSYKAKIEVEITSNKNTNKYIIKQWYVAPNMYKQEIEEPENIKGIITIYDGTNFRIKNSKLDLSKLHEGYNCLIDNSLCLNEFIKECKEKDVEEKVNNNEVELSLISSNKYAKYKKIIMNKTNRITSKNGDNG